MRISLVKRWIKALRSGKYKQGKHLLRSNNNAFCCLGVLCDIVNKKNWHNADNVCYFYDDVHNSIPPKYIQKEAGLNENIMNILTRMNDNRNFSFKAIANYLERKFKLCKS